MRKKNSKNVVTAILIIVISVFLLSYFDMDTSKTLTLVDTTQPSYNCPTGNLVSCLARGTLKCSTPGTDTSKVVSRTSSATNSQGYRLWYALYDDNSKSLISYCLGSVLTTNDVSTATTFNYPTPYNEILYHSYGPSNPCRTSKCYFIQTSAGRFVTYYQGSCGADTSPTSKSSCKAPESCQGTTSRWSCSGTFKTTNPAYTEQLSCASDEGPCSKTSQEVPLNAGANALITGGTGSFISAQVIDNSPTCVKNTCSGDSGYIECVDGKPGGFKSCASGEICKNDKCGPPFSINIEFTDSGRTVADGFSPSEQIKIKSSIISSYSDITVGSVDFKVIKYGDSVSNPLSTKHVANYDFKSGVQYFDIENPGPTYLNQQFYVLVEISYSGKTYLPVGTNQEYSFRIGNKLRCSAGFMSNIDGKTRSTLFMGFPVELTVTSEESGLPSPPDSIDLNIKLNDIPISLTRISDKYLSETKYVFIPSTTGPLDSIISIEKSGVPSACTVIPSSVTNLRITPTFPSLSKYVQKCIQKDKSIDATIELVDSLGGDADVSIEDLTLSVIESDTTLQTDLTDDLRQTSPGHYTFKYTFSKLGNFYFQLRSPLFNDYSTGSIAVESSCVEPDCVQNSDCASKGTGWYCQNDTCVSPGPPWVLYIAIGIGVLVVIIIVVMLFKFTKNKKQTVFTGLEGL
jgi:hypothetical protein